MTFEPSKNCFDLIVSIFSRIFAPFKLKRLRMPLLCLFSLLCMILLIPFRDEDKCATLVQVFFLYFFLSYCKWIIYLFYVQSYVFHIQANCKRIKLPRDLNLSSDPSALVQNNTFKFLSKNHESFQLLILRSESK